MLGALDKLTALLGPARVLTGTDVSEDDWHDESLVAHWHAPDVVVLPHSSAEIAEIITVAREFAMPVTARGSGTGLAGACVPREGGILIAFREMAAILEIDTENHVAVVQPGVTPDAARRGTWRGTGSSTRCSPARTAPASAATSPPTRAGCAR